MDSAAYQLENLHHAYENRIVLNIKERSITKGAITGLSGPNGSGKTTLLKILAFAMEPTSGQILYNGQPQKAFSKQIRSKVTLLTQRPYLLNRTVSDNIAYSLKIKKDTRNIAARVNNALELVGLSPETFARRKPHQLSGGEAQRVAMAARLILEPETLLLDEPVASVDAKSARLIRQATLNAKQLWGTTLIIVSHDLQWLHSVSDHHLSIIDGTLYTTGTENIITGPFEPGSNNDVNKKFEDGQVIRLVQEKKGGNTAVIPSEKLNISDVPFNGCASENQLKGSIASMFLGKNANAVLTHITIGTQDMVLRLSPQKISELGLYPGKIIYLKFSPENIAWI